MAQKVPLELKEKMGLTENQDYLGLLETGENLEKME